MTTPIERAREAALQMADDRLDRTKIGAALALFLDSLADDGLVLVPKEATEEMVQAARGFCNNERSAEFAWDAMLAASQGEGG